MYCKSFTQYNRRESYEVKIGNVTMGGNKPILVQTMTSKATRDIDGSVEQIIKAAGAGAQLVRITVPSMRDLEYLRAIKEKLESIAYHIPLVADIHFNQKIAFEAARIVDKVRINPGNFADSKKFEELDLNIEDYQKELIRIKNEFVPLINICKEHNTALRIGTNHGSLSDRIMSRYGDTPAGMAESAMEFLRICLQENFNNVVVSMKASNTMVMVQAVRILVEKMDQEKMQFPLHLGVTEAGEGEDGRIKSAVGIGALLADGIGDTIRVSLTEEPEEEMPVAKTLVDHFSEYRNHTSIAPVEEVNFDPFSFTRRETLAVGNIGHGQLPVVIGKSLTNDSRKDLLPDYSLISSTEEAVNPADGYLMRLGSDQSIQHLPDNIYPLLSASHPQAYSARRPVFLEFNASQVNSDIINELNDSVGNIILVIGSENINISADIRAAVLRLKQAHNECPVIIKAEYNYNSIEDFQLIAAAELGGLLIDGFCDGLWLGNSSGEINDRDMISTTYGILQASRMRVSKPEYISCPSCGRTQFNIQETTRQIRAKTAHLTGLKIGIMGCIVNGLGEMADADYGYIGGAPGKVNLYHQKNLIKRGVAEDLAVDELIHLIKEKGDWNEPS
jgi:(E)-4-hydroxy-3-methylbut-2-enyl-diphosphate synthase